MSNLPMNLESFKASNQCKIYCQKTNHHARGERNLYKCFFQSPNQHLATPNKISNTLNNPKQVESHTSICECTNIENPKLVESYIVNLNISVTSL